MKEGYRPLDQENTEVRPAQPTLDLPALSAALGSPVTPVVDLHFGRGYSLTAGEQASLELFRTTVRVSMGDRQLAMPRTDAQVSPDAVSFEDEHGSLTVSQSGEVVFRFSPAPSLKNEEPLRGESAPLPQPEPRPHQREAKPKAKSEKNVGHVASPVTTHTTKAGTLVAEVELAIPDPERPGQHTYVKLAAFDKRAEELRDAVRPGDVLSTIGVRHVLERTSKDRRWSEAQIYLIRWKLLSRQGA